jgi:hypothetical protein
MKTMNEHQDAPMKTYVGYIWIDDEPGVRISVSARSPDEAMAAVEAEYGEGHVVSLWNEDDASKQR